jgi:cytochrome b involved in lipid metabolism
MSTTIKLEHASRGIIKINTSTNKVDVDLSWGAGSSRPVAAAAAAAAATPAAEPAAESSSGSYTMEEIAKHNTEQDCWCVVDGMVYDLTDFLPDHPGGKRAPLIYAGKDATEEFMMLHKPEIIVKYGKPYLLGPVAGVSKL